MKKTFELEQQTSMWHFQGREAGAALRATEVKPKLDRFLIEWCKKMHQLDILKEKKNWLADKDHPAFAYKLRIENKGNMVKEQLPGRNSLFCGNMGDDSDEKKMLTKAKESLQLTIMCFNRELLEKLTECLPTFFLLTNFGTRQSKGFGSFVLKNSAVKAEQLLTDWYGAKPIYKIDYGRMNICKEEEKVFRDIEVIYQVLKGGINFGIYIKGFINRYYLNENNQYGLNIRIGGEKRYLKEHKIAPSKGRKPVEKVDEYRYIRALLGTSDSQSWGGFVVRFAGGDIERIPSPILFKPLANRIYILPNDVNPNIYGKKFKFSSDWGKGELNIPAKNEFDMDKFFAAFVDDLNSPDIRDTIKKLKNMPLFAKNNIKVLPCKGVKN